MNRDRQVVAVVVNHNTGTFLGNAIACLRCSGIDIEIVVVDNASSDDSLAALVPAEQSGEVEVIRNDRNLGFSTAVNQGAARYPGHHVLLINPDCLVHGDTVGVLLETLLADPGAGAVGPLVFSQDGREQAGCRRNEPGFLRALARLSRLENRLPARFRINLTAEPVGSGARPVDAVSGACMLVNRQIFDAIGGLDEGYFLHCEDLDLCRRIRDTGAGVLFQPGASVVHAKGAASRSRPFFVEWKKHLGMIRYSRKFRRRGPLGGASSLIAAALVLLRFTVMAPWLALSTVLRGSKRSDAGDKGIRLIEWASTGRDPARSGGQRLLILGAGSATGREILGQGRESGAECLLSSNSASDSRADPGVLVAAREYFLKAPAANLPRVTAMVSAAPIWTAGEWLALAEKLDAGKLVCLSSTSARSKIESSSASERQIAARLLEGEARVRAYADGLGLPWTILRPTLIFAFGADANLSLIRRLIRWFGVFPLAGAGAGLRQPIHAADVARACLLALRDARAQGIYDLPGADTLSYRELVERLFALEGRTPRFLPVPRWLILIASRVSTLIPGLPEITPAMFERMDRDLVFDGGSAVREFGFQPAPLSLHFGTREAG